MIRLKESYGYGYRLFNTETGKYVKNNAENRSRALFCELLQNELDKEDVGARNSVNAVLSVYGRALQLSKTAPLNEVNLGYFISELDHKLDLKNIKDNEAFQKLAFCVMSDQRNEKTETNAYDLSTLSNDYSHLNEKIFAKEYEKTL